MMKYLLHTLLLRSILHHQPNANRWFRLASTSARSSFVDNGHVYFVATPIGNLKDISERAKDILTHVDVVCAEDTRHTIQLLRALELPHKELLSHHEHNWKSTIPKILSMVRDGKSIAVVSDAGTPGISDPGAELAEALGKAGVALHPIPGPSAVIAAMSVCGFPGTEFTFKGFLPVKSRERKAKLVEIYNNQNTVVLFEAPHRIVKTIQDLINQDTNNDDVNLSMTPYQMGDRQCVCCRELTKIHEEIKRGTLSEILIWLKQKEASKDGNTIKGEFCIVLGPIDSVKSFVPVDYEDDETVSENSSSSSSTEEEKPKSIEDNIKAKLNTFKNDGMSRKEAVQMVVSLLKVPRNPVYKIALAMPWD